jgi:hypothetical protein
LSSWPTFALNPQHTAQSPVASQQLQVIQWSTPVDLHPQYSGSDLLIHYGSPLETPGNTLIVPVKTGTTGGFEVEAIDPPTATVKWTNTTDYILPPHGWTPSYSPTLTPTGRLYFAGAGGTVYYIDNPDQTGATITGQLAFYGIGNYTHSGFDNSVFIDTPITADSSGNIYFGFQVTGSNPLNLVSGIAKMAPDGTGTWVSASSASGDSNIAKVTQNCAPALSNDQSKLYITVNYSSTHSSFTSGYLLELNTSDLSTAAKVQVKDTASGNNAYLPDDGTASPMVGPDGDVYIGVLENPFPNNDDRGWMLHYSGDLSTTKTPGAFGWDDTASVVPTSMIPGYSGPSSYLIMTKYNNYIGIGPHGDGHNKVAVLDPNQTETDPVTGATVMLEIDTILGPTPNPSGGVDEWCINSAAVDPATDSILVNSEDGKLYRWYLGNNTLSQTVILTAGLGEAYTTTLIGNDGIVYATNNATLFAVGQVPAISIADVTADPGDSGTTAYTFTVSLSNVSTQSVTVNYATADGTATTAEGDYTAASGTLTFSPGATSQTITVNVSGIGTGEASENFFVNLSSPGNATIARSQATGTILNDDPDPGITVGDVSVTEPHSGTTTIHFRVSLLASSTQTTTVSYATADGTATVADGDYRAASGTLSFAPGVTSQTVTVTVNGDSDIEPDENFYLNLSSPTNGILVRSQATAFIADSGDSLSINDVTVTKGTSGTTNAEFTVSLASVDNAATVSVTYKTATTLGTGTAGVDFIPVSGTLSFAPGVTSQTIDVPVVGSLFSRGTRTFVVLLSGSTNAVISRARGTGTIQDPNALPSIAVSDVNLPDGAPGTHNFPFVVTLSAPSGQNVTVQYATADGSATVAAGDYVAASGTLTFTPGQISKTVNVVVNGDTATEATENFFLNLSNPTNATLANTQGTATLLGDDPDPLLSINNVTATDGSSGTKHFGFTVKLSAASTQTVTVQYATADGTATTGENDYVATSGTLTFNPGQTTKMVSVTVNGNTDLEADENFYVNLSNPTNAGFVNNQGIGTILNDDATLSIADTSVTQPSSGVATMTFTVTLSQATSFPVTVNYGTANNTAFAAKDYVATSGSLTFNPGQTSQTISVLIIGDPAYDPTETMYVNLSGSSNATISRSHAVGTINNTNAAPVLNISSVVLNESDGATTTFTFTVTLVGPTELTTTVQYSTADGTATVADGDYTAASGTLTFTPGHMTQTITVTVNADASTTASEIFYVNLSSPVNAVLGTAQGTGTILNDDGAGA